MQDNENKEKLRQAKWKLDAEEDEALEEDEGSAKGWTLEAIVAGETKVAMMVEGTRSSHVVTQRAERMT